MTPPERPEVAAIWREWEAWIDSLNTVPVEYAPAHTAPFVSRESVRPVAMDFIRRAFEAGAAAAEPLRGALDYADTMLSVIEREGKLAPEQWYDLRNTIAAALEATAPSTPGPALDVERLPIMQLIRELAEAYHQTGSIRDHADPNETGWHVKGIETCGDPLCVEALLASQSRTADG